MRDDEWLEICGKNGWIAFSHDRKFHSVTVEAMAIKQHNVGAFYLPGASEPVWYKLSYFMRGYAQIIDRIKRTQKPFIYRVHPNLWIERIKLP